MIGLAAGVDKNALSLSLWKDMGFDFVVVGTVTADPRWGNPDGAIKPFYNNLGLPNDGIQVILERIREFKKTSFMPIGLSIDSSVVSNIHHYNLSCIDFIELNMTCPSDYQYDFTTDVLSNLRARRPNYTIYNKVGPLDNPVRVESYGNITISNTMNGYSGPFLKYDNLRTIRKINKDNITIIGCGGILTIGDIVDYYEAGANAVQICSALLVLGVENVKGLIQEHHEYRRRNAHK